MILSNSTPMGQTQFWTCLAPLKPDIITLGGHGDFVHFCVHPCGKEFDNKTALFLQTELSLTSYERAHIVRVGLHMVWYDSKKWFVKLGPATSIMFSLLVSTRFCCCSLSSAKEDCFTLAVFNCELGFSSGMINWSLNWSWQLLLIPGHLCNNVLEKLWK